MAVKKIVSLVLAAILISCCAALAQAPERAFKTRAEMLFETKDIGNKGASIWFGSVPATMYIGKSYALPLKTNIKISVMASITCSDESVLSLSNGSDGYVYATPVKVGKVRLTARAVYKGRVFKAYKIVNVKTPVITAVYVESKASAAVGETYKLAPYVKPSIITNVNYKFASGNKAVATVDSNGVVTAIKKGTAVITVKAGQKTAKCKFTVTSEPAPFTGVRRSFLFGMSLGDDDYQDWGFDALPSVYGEVQSVAQLYNRMGITAKSYLNLTKSNLLSQMSSWPSGVSSDDMTYIYYSGHGGLSNGQLEMIASTNEAVTAKELRNKLDAIPGKIVLFLNCCHSGNAIGKSLSPEAFAKAFISEFTAPMSKSAEFVNSKYTVICAAKGSQSGYINSQGVDLFGDAFSDALGWDLMGGYSTGVWHADANNNGKITLSELASYMKNHINQAIANDPGMSGVVQTLVSYPVSSGVVLFEK